RCQHPVVAAVALVAAATPPPGPLPEAERGSRTWFSPPLRFGEGAGGRGGILLGRQDALVVGLGLEKGLIERPLADGALYQFRDGEDGKATRQIPAELAGNHQTVERRPRLGPVVEEVKLDRRVVAARLDHRIDAIGVCRDEIADTLRKAV